MQAIVDKLNKDNSRSTGLVAYAIPFNHSNSFPLTSRLPLKEKFYAYIDLLYLVYCVCACIVCVYLCICVCVCVCVCV